MSLTSASSPSALQLTNKFLSHSLLEKPQPLPAPVPDTPVCISG